MLTDSQTFSSFSVDDLEKAKAFYNDVLGLECEDTMMGFELKTTGNNGIFVYQKDDHQPATFTVLNFAMADIDKAVAHLKERDVLFEHYDLGDGAVTDEAVCCAARPQAKGRTSPGLKTLRATFSRS